LQIWERKNVRSFDPKQFPKKVNGSGLALEFYSDRAAGEQCPIGAAAAIS
jgi:hypothetical protein